MANSLLRHEITETKNNSIAGIGNFYCLGKLIEPEVTAEKNCYLVIFINEKGNRETQTDNTEMSTLGKKHVEHKIDY